MTGGSPGISRSGRSCRGCADRRGDGPGGRRRRSRRGGESGQDRFLRGDRRLPVQARGRLSGETLTLTCEIDAMRGPVGRGKATATVDGKLAARGTLTFAVER